MPLIVPRRLQVSPVRIDARQTEARRPDARDPASEPGRRGVLGAGMAATLAMLSPRAHAADSPASSARPKAGDLLAFFKGERKGQTILPADLKVGDPPSLAWPQDPNTKTLREASRFNQILLIRLDPATIGEKDKAHAADGIVAFSGICTHAQCTVSGWIADKHVFECPCHQSEYDPSQGATVVFGPAPRALPALPLKIADGSLLVAGPFIGRVGMGNTGMG